MTKKKALDVLWFALVGVFLFGAGIVYQWVADKHPVPPLNVPGEVLETSKDQVFVTLEQLGLQDPDYFYETGFTSASTWHDPKAAQDGLTLITSINGEERLQAAVVELDGTSVQHWSVDWFALWPEADHLPEILRPQQQPGTHIHGAVVMDNGDLVFNFEYLGLMRLDVCGDVVWRLPYQTHHSIHRDEKTGNLWVSGRIYHEEPSPAFPNHAPPFSEPTVLEISPDGEILKEISVTGLLQKNDLDALLHIDVFEHIANKNPRSRAVATGDILHLNDVEIFPDHLAAGVFEPGDLMISLRNVHTVLVFDPETEEIVFQKSGGFVGQHDPDFIDGNRISVFDNASGINGDALASRIVTVSGEDPFAKPEIDYQGSEEAPFYTQIMGKHQWLDNGNLLLTESTGGRAFEVDGDGEIVWQYVNLIDDDGLVGMLDEAQRLPPRFDQAFFEERRRQSCGGSQQVAFESDRTE